MGRMVAGILAVVAGAEVERKGARQTLANEQRAQSGKVSTAGRRPFGFAEDRVRHDRSEAAALRRVYRSLLAGKSASGVARDLNQRGLTTPSGRRFTHHAVRQVLMNPRNAGLMTRHGEVLRDVAATWKPIVDEPTWRSAVSKLTDPARRTNHTNERTRLLTGIALCGVCNDGTTVLGASRKYRVGPGEDGEPVYGYEASYLTGLLRPAHPAAEGCPRCAAVGCPARRHDRCIDWRVSDTQSPPVGQ
jgi:hypothetical protein